MGLTGRDIKKMAFKPVKAAINRIDFVKILEALARLEPGQEMERTIGPPLSAFPDQEEIIQKTVELTGAELAAKGERVSVKEIEDYARGISCRYDHELHVMARRAVFNGFCRLFEHHDLNHIFLSADKRELRHLEKLRQARRDGLGVVYLVNHSSHFDEFIVDVVLSQLGVHLPLFAAGSNMMVTPSVERVLMLGSYVIIRRGATKTYLATLFNYCRALGEMGKQQGIFLEAWSGGARTRDGGLRYPRRLVTLQGALATRRDILVQPVVLSYSAVPEDLGLSEGAGGLSWINGLPLWRNLLRRPHKPIRALGLACQGLFGRAYVGLCQPRLLSELDEMRAQASNGLARDEFAALYSMKEIARDKKIMASQLTARGLIRARRENEELVAATRAELEEVFEYHRRTFGHDPDLEDFITQHSLEEVVSDGLRSLRRRKVIGRPPVRSALPRVLAENGLQYYATHGDRRLYSPSAKENIVLVSAGAWGFSLACLIGQRTLEEKTYHNSSLMLFDARDDLIAAIVDQRTHPVHFPKIRLPKNVFPASDATAAFRKATEVLITSPVEFFETDLRRVLGCAANPVTIVIVTRGFEQTGHRLPIEIARRVVQEIGRGDVTLTVLSGPITPQRLVDNDGGTMVLAGAPATTRNLAGLFRGPDFDVFPCDDPVGVQVAAVMTEVYSLLGTYLIRTKDMSGRGRVAAFFRETSEEAIQLALALGGKKETFLPDNPAWSAEYVDAGMGGPGANFGRRAAKSLAKAKQAVLDSSGDSSTELSEEGQLLIGYTGIRSAYLRAKELDLKVPRLRQAYRLFWKD
ncbi:MAG: 1-acyl-sn-glycerol-3-phosphate acyltransferase [Thermodesulfobacteriota bacterium]